MDKTPAYAGDIPVEDIYDDFMEFTNNHTFIPSGGDPNNALDYATAEDVARELSPIYDVGLNLPTSVLILLMRLYSFQIIATAPSYLTNRDIAEHTRPAPVVHPQR